MDLQSHKKKFHGSNLKTPAACLCGVCDPEEITSCSECSQIFKCVDEYISHSSLQHPTCEICSILYLNEAQFKQHNEEYHGSNLKPPAEADDDKREEEVGNKASTNEEHTKDGALFEEPMLPARSNEEILPCFSAQYGSLQLYR